MLFLGLHTNPKHEKRFAFIVIVTDEVND